MYDELVKRLRNRRICIQQSGSLDDFPLLAEAADAIEELSNAGSAYGRGWTLGYDAGREESKPRWIPVMERLPDADGFTLIFTAHGNPGVCYFTNGWWGGYGKDGITHWMPLPEPPKEELG